MKLLAVPAETHPSEESFLLEVLSREHPELKVTVLTARTQGKPEELRWNAADLRTFPERSSLPWVRGLRAYCFDPRYLTEVSRAIRDLEPDVVLVRDLTIPLLVAYLLQPFGGYRLFYQRTYPHEYRWFDPRIAGRYRLPRVWLALRRVENGLLHFLMRRCQAVLTISEAMSEELVQNQGFVPDRLQVYGMGVNETQMEAHEWKPGGDGPSGSIRFAYSGTLGISRDLEKMVEAFAIASRRLPDPKLFLDVYGGSAEDIERLERCAADLGIVDLVHFFGNLPREEMLRKLGQCDLALNYIPEGGRYWVSCPTKQIEYLALGLPSVATNTVDFVLELERGYGGIELGGSRPEDFAEALLRACARLDGLRAQAQSAREEVRAEFSYRAMASRLAELSR